MVDTTVYNLSRPLSQPIVARFCNTFLCRLRGLTFRRKLLPEQGLLLVYEHDSRMDASIHMLFVWIDLAVVWINSGGQVVDVKLARRWRPAYFPKDPACYVLELAACRLNEFNVGDRVRIEK